MVADIGGTTLDDAVRRMMGFLLTNDLSRRYNLCGRNGKKKFRDLALFDVLYGKFPFLISHYRFALKYPSLLYTHNNSEERFVFNSVFNIAITNAMFLSVLSSELSYST